MVKVRGPNSDLCMPMLKAMKNFFFYKVSTGLPTFIKSKYFDKFIYVYINMCKYKKFYSSRIQMEACSQWCSPRINTGSSLIHFIYQ